MLAQTSPMTTLAVVNVDAVDPPRGKIVQIRESAVGHAALALANVDAIHPHRAPPCDTAVSTAPAPPPRRSTSRPAPTADPTHPTKRDRIDVDQYAHKTAT